MNSMKPDKLFMKALLVLFLALVACGSIWAQATGGLVGTISDKGGAVVPNARVTLTNLSTNEMKVVESDEHGNYRFVQILPGMYKIAVEKQGFQQFVMPSVPIRVGETATADASMQVGATSETIEVTTEAPLINTQTSSLNYGVESRQVQQLPLNGRNVLNLMSLVPGVVPQGNTSGNPATANVTGWGNYQIGGGTANQSASYIDGAPINVSYVNGTVLIPTQEAIQEFQVATNNVSPEYGRFAGGIVNMATKGGGNQFHGSLYEYVRNASLNANLYFNKQSGLPRPQYSQNQFGATVGGPMIKDKAFFFASWEQFNLRQQNTTNTTVPSTPMLSGNFSELLSLPKPIQLKNPYTGTNFTGNIIPPQYLNATAKVLSPQLWPAPVGAFATRSPAAGVNFTLAVPRITIYNQWMGRGDQQIGSKNKLFERYSMWHRNNAQNNALQNQMGTRGYFQTDQAVVGDTITLTQNMVADIRASYLRFVNITLPLSCCNFQFSTLGPGWAKYQTQSTFPELPQPNVTGMNNFNTIPTIQDTDNAYVLSGNITHILGRHTLSYGGEMRKIEWMYVQSNSSGGTFGFGGGYSGYGYADFIMGLPTNGSAQEPVLSKGVMWYSGLYVGDSFRWTPKITVNAGVRWEQPGSFTETHGSLTTMLLNLPQPALSTKMGNTVTGGLALINSPQYPYNQWQRLHWNLFSPRVGFAYNPSNQWVVRGGFGMSYLPNVVAFSLGPYNGPTNASITTLTPSPTAGLTPANAITLNDPFPSGIIPPPGRSQAFVDSLLGQGIQSPVPNRTFPYQMQWNLGFQRQLGNSASLSIGYVGARGVHLPLYSVNRDQLPNQYNSLGNALTTTVPNPMFGVIPASSSPLSKATVAQGYLLKPYPQYLYMTEDAPSIGDSAYQALQAMVQKRIRSGGVLTASYTRSYLNGTADVLAPWLEANRFGVGGSIGVQDNNHIKPDPVTGYPGEQSNSSFYLPNRFVFNYVYPLPFGRGQKFLSGANMWVNGFIGNWTINGISTFQDGFPVAMQDSNPNKLENLFAAGNAGPGTGAGVTRPNVVAGCDPNLPGKPSTKLNKYFNTACFSVPGDWEYGNAPRVQSNLRSQGIDSTDFSASKNFPFGGEGKYVLNFRSEFFNIFNWTQFSPPNDQADNTNFGKVTAQYNNPRLIQLSARFTF
jgi:hypothetical protein